jgi:hypothetical protein
MGFFMSKMRVSALVWVAASYTAIGGQLCFALPGDDLLRTVALRGQAAPGAGGAIFNTFSQTPALNESGLAAFLATLQQTGGVTAVNDAGIWSEGSGAMALVARESNPAPGAPSGVLFGSSLGSPILNDQGQTAFIASLQGTGVTTANSSAAFAELAGPLGLIARTGEQAPGTAAGAIFSFLGSVRLSEEDVAFTARLANSVGGVTTNDDSGIWRGDGAAFDVIAREGSPAAGTPAGAVFRDHDGITPVMGAGGHVAFRGVLRTGVGGVTTSNDLGIWSEGGGALALVAREGSQAPGVPAGANFRDFPFSLPSINAVGEVAFNGTLQIGPGVTNSSDSGYWSQGGGGGLALLAREGDPAPGVPGTNFAHLSGSIAINEPGQTAFLGSLQIGSGGVTINDDQGIWVERDGGLELVAREGRQAPGTPSGSNFNFSARSVPTLVLNDAGRLSLFAQLQTGSGGVTLANDIGIWAEDLAGVLRLIVREGDLLEVLPGDFRTVSSLSMRGGTGGDSGQGSGFNNAGQVAFIANFTDGTSGVFVSDVGTIPEPRTLVLGMACALWGAMIRRRHDA